MTEPAANAGPDPAAPADVLWCADLDRAIALFGQLGLRLDTIFPADDPAVVTLSGHGARVRVVRAGQADHEPVGAPPVQPSFSLVRAGDAAWKLGRAGMQYRDLIPDRQGGRYIASHIRIRDGGPVPDYVHFHAIDFQIIYCYRGWVRVVYEDQGEPFVMRAGECVLQPPRIRHRVLEASPGLEVIELGLPAIHATHVDHELALPSAVVRPDRTWGGQRFVRHLPASAQFGPARLAGYEACELGIAAATAGLASVHRVRARAAGSVTELHAADLMFRFILDGAVTLDGVHRLGAADAVVVPAGQAAVWSDATPDLALLEIVLPG
jgi:quercetin dioxygenase-like cupin family protein